MDTLRIADCAATWPHWLRNRRAGVGAPGDYPFGRHDDRPSQASWNEIFSPQVRIRSRTQFGPADIIVALGSIKNYSGELAPQIQVYTPDKADWVKLHDGEPVLS